MIRKSAATGVAVAIGLTVFGGGAIGETRETAPYLHAFEIAAESSFAEAFAADPAFEALDDAQIRQRAKDAAKAFGACHMLAMTVYSEQLQNVAYGAVLAGGSYADAEQAFEQAISAQLEAGGDAARAVARMMVDSIAIGRPCAEQAEGAL